MGSIPNKDSIPRIEDKDIILIEGTKCKEDFNNSTMFLSLDMVQPLRDITSCGAQNPLSRTFLIAKILIPQIHSKTSEFGTFFLRILEFRIHGTKIFEISKFQKFLNKNSKFRILRNGSSGFRSRRSGNPSTHRSFPLNIAKNPADSWPWTSRCRFA